MYLNANPSIASAPSLPLQLILRSQEKLLQRTTESIVFSKPLLNFQGQGFIYPNTINVIQGKTGSHKSRLLECACSCLLARDPAHPGNEVGFSKYDPGQPIRLILADTERNESDQLPYALQQIKKKAGYSLQEQVVNFEFFSLIQVPRLQRHQSLQEYLELVIGQAPDVATVVVLDVITDCVANFNDPKDSMGLTDFLNRMISEHKVTFICVIHENPNGGDKARGHLGTELINKASTQVQIAFQKDASGRDTDLLVVTNLKNRTGARIQPVFLRYDAQQHGLVVAEAELIQEGLDSKRTKLKNAELLEYLIDELQTPTPCSEVVEGVSRHFNCSRTTVMSGLKALVEEGNRQMISASLKGPILCKEASGKHMFYSLQFPADAR